MSKQLLTVVLPAFQFYIATNLKIVKNKGVLLEYTLEKGNKMAKSKHDYNFEIIDQLYNYEVENSIPTEERLAEWHNDIDIVVPKYIEDKGIFL